MDDRKKGMDDRSIEEDLVTKCGRTRRSGY